MEEAETRMLNVNTDEDLDVARDEVVRLRQTRATLSMEIAEKLFDSGLATRVLF